MEIPIYQSNFKVNVISYRFAGRNQVSYRVLNYNLKFNVYIKDKAY